MSGTGCFKKGRFSGIKRRVLLQGIKYKNTFYSHKKLKPYVGTPVLVVGVRDGLLVYDSRRKLICVAKEEL